jgi:hypothetical protein
MQPQAKHAPPEQEQQLITRLQQLADDPLTFAEWVYPWGKRNTPLEHHKGPRGWQREMLTEVRDQIRYNRERQDFGLIPELLQEAVASGRGIGKSAFFGIISHWMQSVNLGSTVMVTANTQPQLKGKTFPELRKWFALAINAHWFERQALSIEYQPWFAKLLAEQLNIDPAYSGVHAVLWDADNPEAFAGAHNHLGMMLLMDEASGIPTSIYNVCPGFFTEASVFRYWFAFGNPRRASGGFFDSFHDAKSPWRTRHIDARTVPGDHSVLQAIIDKYGLDSDEARTEVLGQFPKTGQDQFIGTQTVKDAQTRIVHPDMGAPLIAGGDPARLGNAKAVLRWRQGRDARDVPPPLETSRLDNVALADRWAAEFDRYKPDAINIDAGNGAGVIDILRSRGYKVNEVWFGSASSQPQYADKRTEIWGEMREWLRGGAIDATEQLFKDLTGPLDVGPDSEESKLESKKQMERRGIKSPDHGDALACTFAVKVSRRDARHSRYTDRGRVAKDVDYDVYAHSRAAR